MTRLLGSNLLLLARGTTIFLGLFLNRLRWRFLLLLLLRSVRVSTSSMRFLLRARRNQVGNHGDADSD